MRTISRKLVPAALLCAFVLAAKPAVAQQYNSDNYLSKPHGVATIIVTAGERNSMWMTTFSLVPNWEFTAAAYVFYESDDPKISDGYSTSYYAKYMIFENKAQTGGVAIKAGTGLEPGYLVANVGLEDAFKSYWTNAPVTVPFFNNRLSWDVMPGMSVTREFGVSETTVGAFTYATRLAWYPVSMTWCAGGEVYGAEGKTEATPRVSRRPALGAQSVRGAGTHLRRRVRRLERGRRRIRDHAVHSAVREAGRQQVAADSTTAERATAQRPWRTGACGGGDTVRSRSRAKQAILPPSQSRDSPAPCASSLRPTGPGRPT